MILLADGGSTKCDWILLDDEGEIVFKTRTEGLNPAVFDKTVLEARIRNNKELMAHKDTVKNVHFYGAGCGTETAIALLNEVFRDFFTVATVDIKEDIVAAVYAATTDPGIVCILGTGSNSCYYDGKDIHLPMESLGYIIMDEASGNYFGKRLIRDYYYNRMPKAVATAFENRFDLSTNTVKNNLYKEANPNAYLASFAEFIFTSERNDYFYTIVKEGIEDFVQSHVLCFDKVKEVPVHFIGSIAHFSEDIIKSVLTPHGITLGNIVRRPIDGIIAYYKNQVLN